ncbi:MAG: hypothetical protein ACSHYF_10290 [Verrucomicrobiaceae bacterium]
MSSSISTSRRWLLIYFLTLLVAVGVGWLYAAKFEPETKFWVGAFKERREVLEERPDVAYALFTGDSSCAFGIDAEEYAIQTGRYAHNLGGTRQMGLGVFMEEALAQAREGDEIVLMCSPRMLMAAVGKETKAGAQMRLALGEVSDPETVVKGSRPGFNHLMSLGAKVALRKPLFRYEAGDREGDGQITTEMDDRPGPQEKVFTWTDEGVERAVERLVRWRDRCGVKKVAFSYVMPLEYTDGAIVEENREAKGRLYGQLVEEAGLRFWNLPQGACSSRSADFADTTFHLTKESAKRFTQELAQANRFVE